MRRTLLTTALAAATALSLAACSSSQVAGTGSGQSAAPTSGAEATVKAAQAELDKYGGVPEFTVPNEPFDISKLKGKKIAIVTVDMTTPALASTVKAVQAAAKVAGVTTTLYDAKDTPSEMTGGVAQALAARADGIVLVGIAAGLVSKQLDAAAAAKVPVVAANNNQPDPNAEGQGAGKGIYAVASPDYKHEGRLAADAAIVKTGGSVKALLFTTDGIDPAPAVLSGFQESLKACSTCKVLDTRHVQLQDWFNGNLASLTTSVLTKNRDANIVLPIYATMAMMQVPAAKQAGAGNKVTFFSTSAPPDSAKLLGSTATLGGLAGQSDDNVGWLAVNQVMRGMLGLKPGNPAVSSRYITATTVQKDGTSYAELYGNAHEAGFKELWGLS